MPIKREQTPHPGDFAASLACCDTQAELDTPPAPGGPAAAWVSDPRSIERWRARFTQIDTDGSGDISADELAEFEKWAAGDEGAFDPNQFKDAPPTNDEDYSDDDEFYEEEDARRRVGPARKGADPTAPAATRRPNQFDRSSKNAAEEAFRVAEAIAEQRNHSDSSDGETVSDSEASDQ